MSPATDEDRVADVAFRGFSDRSMQFYADLASNNTRGYWLAHNQDYETEVRGPMAAWVAELGQEFGPVKLLRPNRDIPGPGAGSTRWSAVASSVVKRIGVR